MTIPAVPLAFGLLSATLWGGTGLIEVPTTACLPGGALRVAASEVGERSVETLAVDVGFSDDFELGAARWRLDRGRKGGAVNLKLRIVREKGALPAVAVGVRDAESRVFSEPERYLVLGKSLDRRGALYLGVLDGPRGMEAIGGGSYRLSLSTTLMVDFRRRQVNIGAEFEVPFLGLFAKWAVLDVEGNRDLAVWVGWRL